jgi:polyisoprenoid-binding protein YceI
MKTMKLRAVGLGLVLAAGGVGAVMFAGGAGRVEQGATASAGAFAVDGVHSSVIFRIQRTGGAPF